MLLEMSRTAEPPKPLSKASDKLVARMTPELKEKLGAALSEHPHFRGNYSEWVNACAQAWVLQVRRGEAPAFPVEFVAEK